MPSAVEVSPALEYCIRFNCRFMQSAPLFLGESYLGDDGLAYKECNEQARGYGKDNPVGYRAQPIRHRIPL